MGLGAPVQRESVTVEAQPSKGMRRIADGEAISSKAHVGKLQGRVHAPESFPCRESPAAPKSTPIPTPAVKRRFRCQNPQILMSDFQP